MGVAPTTPELRAAVEANLFPASRAAVEPWDEFPWHGPDTAKINASQALAIDLFGTLKLSSDKDIVLGSLARDLGLPAEGPWKVCLEWSDISPNHMRETARTAVDVVLSSPRALIFVECKFTEISGAKCSQRKPIAKGANRGIVQCNGSYALQTNLANKLESRCALTAKAIRYWEVIPQVFNLTSDIDYSPCPFAGPWFQWMRNLTVCHAVARSQGQQPAFVLAYADGPTLPVAGHVRSLDWQTFLGHTRPEAIQCHAVSFQEILGLIQKAAPDNPVWSELSAWVDNKIKVVCATRAEAKHSHRHRLAAINQ